MMHRWGGRSFGPYYNPGYQDQVEPLDKGEAKNMVEQYITDRRNPNLKAGDVSEETGGFVVDVLTKEGSLADKIFVDKYTG